MKRPYGTGQLYEKNGSYYGRWRTPDGRRLNRRIGSLRAKGVGSRKGAAANVPDMIGKEAGQRITPELVKQVQQILGRTIADSDPAVAACWNQAKQIVLGRNKQPLTRELVNGTLYDRTREEFWKAVRGNDAAAKWFEERGLALTAGGETSAPLIKGFEGFPPSQRLEFLISLDHILPKAVDENWRKALDADNLRFVAFWDNWLLALIERKLPELAR